jgi:hypothetical protein
MKRLLLSLLLLPPCAHSMDDEDILITMPDAQTLTARLNGIEGLSDFAAKTKIIEDLAGEKKYPLGVVNSLNQAMGDYLKKQVHLCPPQQKKSYEKTVVMRRSAILQVLLKDHPEALKSLEKIGQYNPSQAKPNSLETKKE